MSIRYNIYSFVADTYVILPPIEGEWTISSGKWFCNECCWLVPGTLEP